MVDTVSVIAVWVQLVATIYLVGLIWCIQVVHYPLMNRIDGHRFEEFHRQHGLRISLIVVLPMVIELASSALLAVSVPDGVTPTLPTLGVILIAVIWISTFAIQVPLHRKLAGGFDARTHRMLVRSNWIRTTAWSLRAAIAVATAVTA